MYSVVKIHEGFLLINKHPGVTFHKNEGQRGLIEILRTDLHIDELYAVHRLDSMTSGLLIFARDRDNAKELSRQFQHKEVEKYYLAISDRCPKKKQGTIKGDMERARRGAWKLARTMKSPAVTRFFSYSSGEGLRFFILKPHTGKTHQIRVAMKSIGSPVLGDPVYHKKGAGDKGPDRGYLHSYALRFQLKEQVFEFIHQPDIGAYFLSDGFKRILKKINKPWEMKWPST